MKVEIRVEISDIEILNAGGVLAGDMAVPHVLADDGSVLAFHQRIVGRVQRPRLGEFDCQLLQ